MRLIRFAIFFCVLSVLFVTTFALPCAAQTTRRRTTTPRITTPRVPARHETLLVEVSSVPAIGQAIVQTMANGDVLPPADLAAPFPVTITRKTKFFHTDGRTTPFTPGEKVIVKVDIYGMAQGVQNVQGMVREVWDIAAWDAQQRLRKEVATGKVVQGIMGQETTGLLTITRDDGTQAQYKVTNKTRFCKGDVQVMPSVYQTGMVVSVRPRSLPSGGTMAAIVAESPDAVQKAYKDTLTVWEGVVKRVEMGAFYFTLRRDDEAVRTVRFPQVIKIQTAEDEKKPVPGRVFLLTELIEHKVKVHLVRGEHPAPDGTRTADHITLMEKSPGYANPLPPALNPPKPPIVEPSLPKNKP